MLSTLSTDASVNVDSIDGNKIVDVDRHTAEIIEQIEDAIVDVDIDDNDDDDENNDKKEILIEQKIEKISSPSSAITKQQKKIDVDSSVEKSDKLKSGADDAATDVKSKVIDSNVAFDELGGKWNFIIIGYLLTSLILLLECLYSVFITFIFIRQIWHVYFGLFYQLRQ